MDWGGGTSFDKHNIFAGFGKPSPLARHVKIFQPLFPKHDCGAEPNRVLSAHLFLHELRHRIETFMQRFSATHVPKDPMEQEICQCMN
jgi:hypothetical protein